MILGDSLIYKVHNRKFIYQIITRKILQKNTHFVRKESQTGFQTRIFSHVNESNPKIMTNIHCFFFLSIGEKTKQLIFPGNDYQTGPTRTSSQHVLVNSQAKLKFAFLLSDSNSPVFAQTHFRQWKEH